MRITSNTKDLDTIMKVINMSVIFIFFSFAHLAWANSGAGSVKTEPKVVDKFNAY